MTDFRTFVYKVAALFALPWLFMIVLPAINYTSLTPQQYDKDKGDELDNAYWYPLVGPATTQGAVIYAHEGCVQCHSQMLRGTNTLDAWHKGWGQDQSVKPGPARPSTIRDYFGEQSAFLGLTRMGPDLTNAGYRFETRTAVHQHLYKPRSVNAWTTMPSYDHLYKVQPITGQGSANAVPVKGKLAPKDGYEVVPTPEAEQLVSYILSLKRDYARPGDAKALAGATPAKK
jgi:cytochrome c oxidase cbb3-type subunit 2